MQKHTEITEVFKTGERRINDWRCKGWNVYENGVFIRFIKRHIHETPTPKEIKKAEKWRLVL